MMVRLLMLALLLSCLGCGRIAPVAVAVDAAPSTRLRAASVRADVAPSAPRITITPEAETGHIHVRIEGFADADWTPPSPPEAVVDWRKEHGALTYAVIPGGASPCPFAVSPDRASFCGAAVLATPTETETLRDLTIVLRGSDGFYPHAASSFGVGHTASVHASFAQLHRAGFLLGDVHHATFDAPEGRDHAAWLGYFSFDPRWVAAEAAGVRTAVDRWLGVRRPPDDPTVGLLFTSIADTGQRVDIRPLHRGALLEAGPSAPWSFRARIDLARLLVQRTLGGAVSVTDLGAERWFDEGVAHAVALRVLVAIGVATPDDVAAEVSAWLAEEVLSPHAGSSLDTLAALPDTDARRLLAVRGALLATSLGPEALHATVRGLLAKPGNTSFFAVAAEAKANVEAAHAALLRGTPIPLDAANVSACVGLVRRSVYAFSLGFTHDDGEVIAVDAGSPAERAGVRAGDTIRSLTFEEGRSDIAVEIALGDDATRRFLPRGLSRPARALVVTSRDGACAP